MPEDSWASWVVVFGFPADLTSAVKRQFESYGHIEKHTIGDGNWMLVKYVTVPPRRSRLSKPMCELRRCAGTRLPSRPRKRSHRIT
jgi:hypothetical protein